MSIDNLEDDDIENLLSHNQVLINDRFDPVLKSVRSELGTGEEIELEQDDMLRRKSSFFEKKMSMSTSGLSRMFGIHSSITTILIWWIRHSPGERDILNESAVCAEQIIILFFSLIVLKKLSHQKPIHKIIYEIFFPIKKSYNQNKNNKNNNEEDEDEENIYFNYFQIIVGSFTTIFSGFAFWAGVGHLDIILCSVIWESRGALLSLFIALIYWYKIIPNAMKLKITCTQWFGIMLIIFSLITLEHFNRQEAKDELILSKDVNIDHITPSTSSSSDSSSSSSFLNHNITSPSSQLVKHFLRHLLVQNHDQSISPDHQGVEHEGKGEQMKISNNNNENIEMVEDIQSSNMIESTKKWETTHHEGYITMFSSVILYIGNNIHTQLQILTYKNKKSLITTSIEENEKQNKNEKKELLLVLWIFIFKRSLLSISISFLISFYISKGDLFKVFQGFDHFLTILALLLNAIGGILTIGLCVDLFSPDIDFKTTMKNNNDNNDEKNNKVKNKNQQDDIKDTKQGVAIRMNILGSSAGVSLILTVVLTSLFLGSSGLNPRIMIGFGIATYGTLLHGGMLGGELPSIALFAPDDQENLDDDDDAGTSTLRNGEFIVQR